MGGHGLIGNYAPTAHVVLVENLPEAPDLTPPTLGEKSSQSVVAQLVRSDDKVKVRAIPAAIRHVRSAYHLEQWKAVLYVKTSTLGRITLKAMPTRIRPRARDPIAFTVRPGLNAA